MSDVEAHLRARAESDGVEFFFAMFVDMHGKPCAKMIPLEALGVLTGGGAGFAGFAAGPMGQTPADPDMIAVPDPESYTLTPWRPGLAVLQCDIHVEGEPWPYAPRVILKGMLDKARERGLVYNAGCEAEYFLVRRRAEGGIELADPLARSEAPCYDAKGLTRMYDHLTTVSKYMNQLGWANYANDHEDANGQFEQNFKYADAMTTADRVITGRYLISVLAEQRGMTATFMPKPFADRTGSGLHLHMSLWNDGAALFPDAGAEPYGLSATARQFLAGILDHAVGMQAVLGPTVNSYKRTGARTTRSGASWSPKKVTYGGNDRTHFVRVPDGNRIEMRGGDGSANPYLAMSVALAAGLDGIERGLALCDPGYGTLDLP